MQIPWSLAVLLVVAALPVCAQTDGGGMPSDLVPDTTSAAPKYFDGSDSVTITDESAAPAPAVVDDEDVPSPAHKPAARLVGDSSAIAGRAPDQAMLRRFRVDPDFDYSDTLDEKSESRSGPSKTGSSRRGSSRSFGGGFTLPALGGAGSIVFYVFAGIAIAVLIYFIAMSFRRKPKSVKTEEGGAEAKTEENTEDIRELDFDALLARVIASGDLRRAVRLMYLQSLRLMTDRGLIKWNIHTSNREYLYQAPDALRPSFRRTTDLFEYVWYGEFPITAPAFERVRGEFADFTSRINRQA